MLDDPDAAAPAAPAPGVFFRIAARLRAVDAAAAAAVAAAAVGLPLTMTPPAFFLSAGLPSTSAAVTDRPPAVEVLAARLTMLSGDFLADGSGGGGGRGRERFLGRAKAALLVDAVVAALLSGLSSPVRSMVSPIRL